MLDLTEIKNTIEELENAPTTFANCQKIGKFIYRIKSYQHTRKAK